MWIRVSLVVLSLAIGACGGGGGGGQIDASPPDAVPPDAALPDAAPAARTMREIVGGGGRATGGTLTMEAQIGHGVGQQPSTGGTLTLEGGAAVKKKRNP